jgi:hypothetical protein
MHSCINTIIIIITLSSIIIITLTQSAATAAHVERCAACAAPQDVLQAAIAAADGKPHGFAAVQLPVSRRAARSPAAPPLRCTAPERRADESTTALRHHESPP